MRDHPDQKVGEPGELQRLLRVTATGTAWNYAVFAGAKGLAFLATLILARLLVPDDFGLLAIGLLAMRFLESLSQLGIGAAVVQRRDQPERSAHVAFGLSLGMGILLAVVTVLAAPLVAAFFEEPRAAAVTRVLAVSFLLTAVSQIHESRLQKRLDFRRRFLPEIGGAVGKGGVSILLAWLGFGVWSLVWGKLGGQAMRAGLYWLTSRWRPRPVFDRALAASLLRFGAQITLLNLLAVLVNNLDYIFIGRRMDAMQLGFYTMGFRLPELVIVSFCMVVGKALFPAYARLQHDVALLRGGFLSTLRFTSLLTVPAGLGMFFVANEAVEVFYGSRWLPAALPMRYLALFSLAMSFSFNAGDVFKAIGRPVVLTRMMVVRLCVLAPLLWFAAGYDIGYVALGHALVAVAFATAMLVITCRLLEVRAGQLLSAFRTSSIAGLAMGLALKSVGVQLASLAPMPRLAALISVGGLVYIAAVLLLDRRLVADVGAVVASKGGRDSRAVGNDRLA